ncbi:MAG: hypothetical protein E7225_03315 [Clostridiales bacterium]|nr:hypothetical protein [Clostridiales bacterium]
MLNKSIKFDSFNIQLSHDHRCTYDSPGNGCELLFIEDNKGSYMISFESGMDLFDMHLLKKDKEAYNHIEIHENSNTLSVIYPKDNTGYITYMVYFHFEITDDNGGVCMLPGQMALMNSGQELMKTKGFNTLYEILKTIELSKYN